MLPSASVEYEKYSLCGNTFLFVNEGATRMRDDAERAAFARWALDEPFGIGGADNVIYLAPGPTGSHSQHGNPGPNDRTYGFRIFEQDGSETLFCGNAVLCSAAVVGPGQLLTEQPTGRPHPVRIGMREDGCAWADIGSARRVPPDLFHRTFVAKGSADGAPAEDTVEGLDLEIGCASLTGWLTFTGEPHLVLVLGRGTTPDWRAPLFPSAEEAIDDSNALLGRLGWAVNRDYMDLFPYGVHVNVVDVLDGATLRYRTWERAINRETLACGSGALACAHVCRALGLTPGERLDLLPYRCRRRQADAVLQVSVGADRLTLAGRPTRIYAGVVTPGAASHDPGKASRSWPL